MPSEFSFSLSLAAMDLLWEQQRLGTPVRIFEIPSVGTTMRDRDRLREAVFNDLAARGLANRGRLSADVEEALTALGRFETAIDVVGLLDEHERLLARAATDGRVGVLARMHERSVAFDLFRPEGVLGEAVRLIGEEKPGPGRSVTYPEPDPEAERRAALLRRRDEGGGFRGVFEPSRQPQGGYDLERRAAQSMWERRRKRIGMFTVYARDRYGRELMTPVLSWFDTDDGRYLGHSRPGPDGQRWTTYSPADTRRITQMLAGMIDSVRRPAQPQR
jgi:hypothetical protein